MEDDETTERKNRPLQGRWVLLEEKLLYVQFVQI
jgi:hypothetical protein